MCAVYPDARNPFAHPELLEAGLEPWTVPEVWLSGHPEPTDVIDVTAFVDRKFDALLSHASQHPDPEGMPGPLAECIPPPGGGFRPAGGRGRERG